MAERAFIDSNILLYAIGDDAGRREVAEALLVQRPVVSAQVIAELSAVLRRKFGYAPAAVVSVLEAILPRVHCEPVTAQIVLSALAVGNDSATRTTTARSSRERWRPTAACCTRRICSTGSGSMTG